MATPNLTLDQYDKLVAAAYAAGLEPSRWHEFCHLLEESLVGVLFMLQGHDLRSNSNILYITEKLNREFVKSYHEYYSTKNPWMPALQSAPVGVPLIPDDVVPRELLFRTEFYNDWILPQDNIASGAGIVIFNEADRMLALTGNIRISDEEKYQANALNTLARLAPHLQRAFEIQRILMGTGLLAKGLFIERDHPGSAAFMIGSDGSIIFVNSLAETLLREGRLLRATSKKFLHCVNQAADNKLYSGLAAIRTRKLDLCDDEFFLGADSFGVTIPARLVPITVEPENCHFYRLFAYGAFPAAILVVTRPAGETYSRRLLHEYGLTHAELRVATSLAKGMSLDEHAQRAGISRHTARNQLKSIFEKTATHRQAQLVALIGRLSQA